jgi:hypothetical protein
MRRAVTVNETHDPRAAFIDASLWHGSLDRSNEILAAHPEIAGTDIHTAAILGSAGSWNLIRRTPPQREARAGGTR